MKRRYTRGFAALLAGAISLPAVAAAQQDPTELAGGKKPYILIIMDSSASMEYTTVDDNRYPTTDYWDGFPNTRSSFGGLGSFESDEWFPGDEIDADSSAGFGSCYIYDPGSLFGVPLCGNYNRPSRRPDIPAGWSLPATPNSWLAGDLSRSAIEDAMRGTYYWSRWSFSPLNGFGSDHGWRMQDPTQPRHVTVKEILTGSMILLPNDATTYGFDPTNYDPDYYGPGCWFVPRQRDASAQPLSDQTYLDGCAGFENLPEHEQPLPHFQETYDLQWSNGVLDTLSGTALFAVAAFDSFRDDISWDGFSNDLNDNMRGDSPPDLSGYRDSDVNEDSNDCDGDSGTDDPCYNLGVWSVIGPNELNVPTSILSELAAYTQIAINDVGMLNEENDDDFLLDVSDNSAANSFLGVTFSSNMKKYAEDVELGKHPIARATPIAAAIHDVYQFMAEGQGSPNIDPINDDDFAQCRPKHVVILTDGSPAPERDAGGGVSDTLNEAFGYQLGQYPYDTAENEINALVNDPTDLVPPDASASAADHDKYDVRVHIIGLNLDTQDDTAVAKMAQMAVEGKQCAAILGADYVPIGTQFDAGGGTLEDGTCVAGTGCLVPQGAYTSAYLGGGYDWTHPNTAEIFECDDFPALVLDDTNPEVLQAAVSQYLQELTGTGGLTSRTRLVVSNRLDDTGVAQGGQYRVYSGVRVGGGSAWWKGVLNRNTIFCDGSDPTEISLDAEVADLIDISGGISDSRRFWTSLPTDDLWDYTTNQPLTAWSTSGDADFPFVYPLIIDTDDFGDTYLEGPDLDPNEIVGTRIPFEYTQLVGALDTQGTVADGTITIGLEYNVTDEAEMKTTLNAFRARITERLSTLRGGSITNVSGNQDRVVGGILNSNPIVVGPPSQDLPIASYRDFRAKYADRPTMMYSNTVDGTLHALYMGTLENRINERAPYTEDAWSLTDTVGSAVDQREAWAFTPWMVHRELSAYQNAQGYLMDGATVVKDVRLCNQDPDLNQAQACKALCPGGGCSGTPGEEQWRTVLVQARGLAGDGYYAMDVTRPGGLQVDTGGAFAVENPDPVLLWEFDRNIETVQLDHWINRDSQPGRIRSTGVSPDSAYYSGAECGNDVDQLYASSLMGLSVSEPEIGTVIVDGIQRPVAVFGGGQIDPNTATCGASAAGMAIYVVDLQSGTLLRRFMSYKDGASEETMLHATDPRRFTGSPVLFDGATGAVATRGFIGDDKGRLYKIDFLDPNPLNWEVSLFFDPYADMDLTSAYTTEGNSLVAGAPVWGPAAYKPAVALNASREVMVVYGLGEVGDAVTSGQAQAVIALTENRSSPNSGIIAWAQVFPPAEKVTGAPIIFNADVYFPTYALPEEDSCEPGHARVWGLDLRELDTGSIDPTGVFGSHPDIGAATAPTGILRGPGPSPDFRWFGPDEPTLIRGLTVTLGPLCSIDNIGSDNPAYSTGDAPRPQLIAQTSSAVDNDLRNTDQGTSGAGVNLLDRISLDIEPPQSQTIPLSWTLVF